MIRKKWLICTLLLCLPTALTNVVDATVAAHGQPSSQPGNVDDDPLPPGAVARLGTARFRQGEVVLCLDLSPDGKTVVSRDGEVLRLWDLSTGKELRQYLGHEDFINSVAFSPDGNFLASYSRDKTVIVWHAATGKERHRFRHNRLVDGVAFSPDGKLLASGSHDGTFRLWDLATGKEVRRIDRGDPPGGRERHVVVFAPDGKTLLLCEETGTVRRWDTATGASLPPIVTADEKSWATALTPDGKYLATSSRNAIHLWELGNGREVRRFSQARSDHPVAALAFSPDGGQLASSSWDCKLQLWEVGTGKLLGQLEGHQKTCGVLRFAPNGKTLVTGGWDHTIRVWDVARREERRPSPGHNGIVHSLSFSADGRSIVSQDGTFRRWQATTAQQLPRLAFPEFEGRTITFSPDRRLLALATREQPSEAERAAFLEVLNREAVMRGYSPSLTCTTIQLHDLRTGKLLHSFGKSFEGARALAFSADSAQLAEGREDGVVCIWDPVTAQVVQRLGRKQPAQAVSHLAFDPDGRTVVARHGQTFRTWDVATGKLLCEFGQEVPYQECLAFAPDGKAVVTSSAEELICFWDPRTGRKLRELPGHRGDVHALVFSPDGKMLASGGEDRTVRLWELATGGQRLCFRGHRGRVEALAFSPDGRLLVSGSSDTTALVWDVAWKPTE